MTCEPEFTAEQGQVGRHTHLPSSPPPDLTKGSEGHTRGPEGLEGIASVWLMQVSQ